MVAWVFCVICVAGFHVSPWDFVSWGGRAHCCVSLAASLCPCLLSGEQLYLADNAAPFDPGWEGMGLFLAVVANGIVMWYHQLGDNKGRIFPCGITFPQDFALPLIRWRWWRRPSTLWLLLLCSLLVSFPSTLCISHIWGYIPSSLCFSSVYKLWLVVIVVGWWLCFKEGVYLEPLP